MENSATMLETLFEKAEDFGKTSFELVKLKTIDKTAQIVSSFIPYSVVIILVTSFMIFLNLGLAFYIGALLGEIYLGFFVIAAFYVLTVLIFYVFFHKRLKRSICNSIINQMLN